MFIRKKSALAFIFFVILISVNLIGCKPEPEKEAEIKEESIKTNKGQTAKSDKAEESAQQAEKQKMRVVKLYFADGNAEYLIAEEREVPDSSKLLQNTLEALLQGPKQEGLIKTIPDGTKIISMNITDETVLVNFSREFVDNHPGGSAFELMTVYSIVDTITEFSGLRRVKFLVEGQEITDLAGHLDLTQPLERDESMIKK